MRKLSICMLISCLAFGFIFGVVGHAADLAVLMRSGHFKMEPPDYTPPTYQLNIPLNRPSDFDVDEYGRLYILDTGRSAVSIFSPTGQLESVWSENAFSPAKLNFGHLDVISSDLVFLSRGFNSYEQSQNIIRISPYEPNGFSFLPDGRFCGQALGMPDGSYLEHYHFDELIMRNPDGSIRWKSPTGATKDDMIPAGLDSFGNLYMFFWQTNRFCVWDRNGRKVRDFVIPLRVPTVPEDRYWQLAVDRNGAVYASNHDNIFRIDDDGKAVSIITPWADPKEHRWPPSIREIKVRRGIIYAELAARGSSDELSEIQAFTADGRCIARYLYPKIMYNHPRFVAVQPDGTFVVSLSSTLQGDKTFRVNSDGDKIGKMGDIETIYDGIILPDSSFYIIGGRGFEKLSASGERIATMSSQIEPLITNKWPELDGKRVMAMCSYPPNGGVCFVAMPRPPDDPNNQDEPDGQNHVEVLVLGPDGSFIRTVPVAPDNGSPCNVAADKNGNIYVCYMSRNVPIIKYDVFGNEVARIGVGTGSWKLGELSFPSKMLVDSAGNLLVLDTGNSRIQAFSPNGRPLGIWGKPGCGDGELDNPAYMCFGPNETLWIADTHNDRIIWIPLKRFWNELTTQATEPSESVSLAKREVLPKPGRVTLSGVVIADSRDGDIYVQHPSGSWGVRVAPAKGMKLTRGKNYRITGTLLASNGVNLLKATSAKPLKDSAPRKFNAANSLLVGQDIAKPLQSGVLASTWGKVLSIDKDKRSFSISDGSASAKGLKVNLSKGISSRTTVRTGDYVAVTGVTIRKTLQITDLRDIKDLGDAKNEVAMLSMR